MATYVFDIETDGLLPTLTKVHCLVLRDVDTGEVFSYWHTDIEVGVRRLQAAEFIIGHNVLKFDIPALQKLYPWFQVYPYGSDAPLGPEVIDTLVCTRLIWSDISDSDQGRVQVGRLPRKHMGSHSLEAWGYRLRLQKGEYGAWFKEQAGDTYQPGDEWREWCPEMQDYCVLDTEVTLALWKRIEAKNYSGQALWLEHRFAAIIAQQERFGFAFDVASASALYGRLVERRLSLKGDLQEAFPARWVGTPGEFKRSCRRFMEYPNGAWRRFYKGRYQVGCWRDETEGEEFTKLHWQEFNPSSRRQIGDRLKSMGWEPQEFTPEGQPKIDETILEKLPYPQAKVLAEYFLVEKRIGMLAEGDQAWLRLERNGRIHGSVNTNGAVTGRCTHSNPNVAQVPSVGTPYGEDCRALFTASLGTLVGADLSGLELRCLAHFMSRWDGGAYGRVLLEGDIHTVNQEAAGLPTRGNAKTFIYAFLYGAGDAKIGSIVEPLADEARQKQAGAKLRKAFLKKTPALKALKEAVQAKAETGFLTGLDGRQLRIRSAHAALNTLLQSAGALIAKLATVFAYDHLSSRGYVFGRDWALVAHVHDELQVDCREEIADEVGQCIVACMQSAGDAFSFRLPIDGEYKLGRNWAETH